MTEQQPPVVPAERYGPAGFLAATVNVLLLVFITWITLPLVIVTLFMAFPVFVIDLIASAVLFRAAGRAGQVGRGMLIGCIAAPLSLLIFVPGYLMVVA